MSAASAGSRARHAAVLGFPIEHSLSPVLHRAAYAALGHADWSYTAIACREAELPGIVAKLNEQWIGLSLTMPLKRVALEVADQAAPLALAVGAANTLYRSAEGWRADNTDVAGIVAAVRAAGVTSIERAVILGAGGTAAAAVAALSELAAADIIVSVRNADRAEELRAAAARLDVPIEVRGGLLEQRLPPADLIISTLPAGAADRIQWAAAQPPATVLDVVYAPWPTEFAARAESAGATLVSGLDMLLYQAGEQVRRFTGEPAPLAVMRSALTAAARPGSDR
jgi:shikimate dehydrogenase